MTLLTVLDDVALDDVHLFEQEEVLLQQRVYFEAASEGHSQEEAERMNADTLRVFLLRSFKNCAFLLSVGAHLVVGPDTDDLILSAGDEDAPASRTRYAEDFGVVVAGREELLQLDFIFSTRLVAQQEVLPLGLGQWG